DKRRINFCTPHPPLRGTLSLRARDFRETLLYFLSPLQFERGLHASFTLPSCRSDFRHSLGSIPCSKSCLDVSPSLNSPVHRSTSSLAAPGIPARRRTALVCPNCSTGPGERCDPPCSKSHTRARMA